jgi:hypothetical protein
MTEPVLQTLEPKNAEQPGVYTWTFPGAPIRISIHLDVVKKLQTAASRSSTNGRPLDIGGLLFGRSQSATVEIIDYQLLPGGKGSNGYTLNELELERSLAKLGASRESGAKSPVVGFFRTQRENSLMLRDEEIEAVHRHFNDPDQVILLIRVLPEQITAGFLFWDGGVLTPFSFMEFPLDAELLRFEAADPSDSSSVGRVRPVEAAPKEGSRLRGKLLAACAAVVAFAGLSTFLTRHQWMPAPKPAAPVTVQKAPVPPRFPLQLDVEAQGKGLNIRWNSQSVPVVEAREGRLVIMEPGQPPQIINLDPAQLSNGHVYYQSSAERLEFRLEVIDGNGKTASESVLALSSKPAAPSNSQVAGREPARQVRIIPIPEPDQPTDVTQADKIARQAPRQFTAPTRRTPEPDRTIVLDQGPPETGDAALARGLRPPGPVSGLPTLAVPPPPARTEPVTNPPPPAPAVSSPPVPAPTTETRLAQMPAVPKWRVSPTLEPALRSQIRKEVEISIRARIDDTGRVVKAEAITHQAGYLEASAITAMMKWRFEPAHLGNKAVPSEQIVNFVFRSQ